MEINLNKHSVDLCAVVPSLLENKSQRDIITIKKLPIHTTEKPAFQIFNFFTPKECKKLIQTTESKGYQELYEYNKNYRSNTRIIISDANFAKAMWERVKHVIPDTIVEKQTTWKAIGLNEQFRFCRYTKGQHFSAHGDAYFMRNKNEKSMLTFMIYLNGNCNGGKTNFLKKRWSSKKEEIGQDPKNIICSVAPEEGMVLCFKHEILHEGQQLYDGLKYLMRSDVMYVRN